MIREAHLAIEFGKAETAKARSFRIEFLP